MRHEYQLSNLVDDEVAVELERRAARKARDERRRKDRRIKVLHGILGPDEVIPTPEQLDTFYAEMTAWENQRAALRRMVS